MMITAMMKMLTALTSERHERFIQFYSFKVGAEGGGMKVEDRGLRTKENKDLDETSLYYKKCGKLGSWFFLSLSPRSLAPTLKK